MFDQELAQLGGVAEAFLAADEEGFERGTDGMTGASTGRTLVLPLFNQGPSKEGKEGALLHNHRGMGEQSAPDGLVKKRRRG